MRASTHPIRRSTFNLSMFAYLNDAAGRRVEVTRSGAAFGALAGATDAYGYNARSEVVSSRRTVGNNEVRGFNFDYAYDPIGNRVTSTYYDEQGEAQTSAYTANSLNQYTQRTVPGNVQVRGEAAADATVTVNGNPTWRNGEYFYGGDYADNDGFPVFKDVAVEAVVPAPEPGLPDETSAVTGRVFVAASPEQFTYDADGNMTSDGRFRYTWNAENRLVLAQELCAPSNRFPYTVSYAYDHRGRMVSKRITENDGSDTLVSSTTYLWDGWNIIREIQWPVASGQLPVVTDNVWGLDIDGTLQGAGGVGGLLAVVKSDCTATNANPNLQLTTYNSQLYFPTYDANGNITEYVTTNGEIVAHYDYSPFGEPLIESGDLASSFTHRFSTKPWCAITGLCEYQMRKYRPEIGRWLSRDPIGEKGGAQLYLLCENNALNRFDVLGCITPLDVIVYAAVGGIAGGITAALTGGDVLGGAVGGIVSGACLAIFPWAPAQCNAFGGAVSGFISGFRSKYKKELCGAKWYVHIAACVAISSSAGFVFGKFGGEIENVVGTWNKTIMVSSIKIDIEISGASFYSGFAASLSSRTAELILVDIPESIEKEVLRMGEERNKKIQEADIEMNANGIFK